MRALTLVLHASENPEAVRTGATKGITMHGYPSKVELRHMTRQPLPAVPTESTGSLLQSSAQKFILQVTKHRIIITVPHAVDEVSD